MINEGQAQVQQVGHAPSLSDISQQHGDYLRFRIDPSPMLVQLQRLIGAKIWDNINGRWIPDTTRRPLATEQFINDLMTSLYGYVNLNNIQGNITDIEAHTISLKASEELIFLVGQRCDEYQIEPVNRDVIINLIDDMIFLTLSRAINDGQRIHDDTSFTSVQSSRGMGGSIESKYLPKMFGG